MNIIRLRCLEGDPEIVCERDFENIDDRNDILASIYEEYGIDPVDEDSLTENYFDCMDMENDVSYVVSVFEEGQQDPYNTATAEMQEILAELRGHLA